MPINGLTPITSLALVAVGAMMFSNLKLLDWDNKIIVFASFVIVIMMLLTYSLSDGLGFGLITYSLMMILLVQRNLNFDSFDHIGAIAHGVHTGLVGIVFLISLAMSVAIGAQIVGSLLVFILLTLPSSTARYIGRTIPAMIAWSVFFALIGVWAGLYLGFITNWPVTFFIATIEVVIYLVAYGLHVVKHR